MAFVVGASSIQRKGMDGFEAMVGAIESMAMSEFCCMRTERGEEQDEED